MSKIRVITGKRGVGKSRFCLRLLDRFREEGLSTAGIISPAVYTDGVKTAFMTMDARTGNTRPCGTRTDTGSGTIGCWQIDPEVLAWGNELLRGSCPCDRLFIDELGPLELNRGAGYTAAFDVLKAGNFGEAYVVIRPECIADFRGIFPEFSMIRAGEE